MQFIMNAQGFKATGKIGFESKEKFFKVNCEHDVEYKYAGSMDVKKNKDIFDRYLAVCGRELAKVWLKKEPSVIKAVQKLLDKAESVFLKKTKKLKSQQEIIDLANSIQKALQKIAGEVMEKKLGSAADETAKASHDTAMKVIAKEAKDVLKSKKSIAYTITINVVKFALVVVGVAAGAVVVAATGGTALVVGLGVAAIVVKSITALVTAAKSVKSVQKDLQSNYDAYAESIDKLNDQIQETIKLSRGLTSNWDRLHLQHASAMGELKTITDNIPDTEAGDPDSKKVLKLKDQIAKDGASIEKILDYKPTEIEASLVKARSLIPSKSEVDRLSKRLDAAEKWFGRLGQWVNGAKDTLKLAS